MIYIDHSFLIPASQSSISIICSNPNTSLQHLSRKLCIILWDEQEFVRHMAESGSQLTRPDFGIALDAKLYVDALLAGVDGVCEAPDLAALAIAFGLQGPF